MKSTSGVERQVILTANNTLVTAHSGTTAVLPCTVDMEYRFGVVSSQLRFYVFSKKRYLIYNNESEILNARKRNTDFIKDFQEKIFIC
jgi:hypothetical protein